MPSNGEISKIFAVFKTVCCDAEIVINAGVPFPDCPNHKNLPTEWKQIADVDPRTHEPNTRGKIKVAGSSKPGRAKG